MAVSSQRRFGLGWVPDLPDHRDLTYSAPLRLAKAALPTSVDLTKKCPPVYDQLHLNSCSANAIAAALRYNELREGRPDVSSPSRLFIYYNERVLAGVIGTNGAVPGAAWGDHDNGGLPYDFFASPDLTWDFWTMRHIS
jgi:C1A family cysteine protease